MIALRANDGSSPAEFYTPGPPVPGHGRPTPSCPVVNGVAVGIAFQWQNIVPLYRSARDFLLDPPHPSLAANMRSVPRSHDRGQREHTQRPPDRANVALFYAASSPTQVFNQAAEEIAEAQQRSCLKPLALSP